MGDPNGDLLSLLPVKPKRWKITDPDTGRTITVDGDEPPDDAEAAQLLDQDRRNRTPAPSTFENPITRAAAKAEEADKWKERFDPSGATIRDSLPAIGGAVGGVIGGGTGLATTGFGVVPGAVGGAALGGAAGEAWKQNIRRWQGLDVPNTALDAAKDIGTEAAWNAGTEVTGGLANRAAVATAKGLVKHGARPTINFLKEFPTVLEDFLKARGASFSKGGAETNRAVTTGSRESADRLIREAQEAAPPGGGALDLTDDIEGPVYDRVHPEAESLRLGGKPSGMDTLERRMVELRKAHVNPEAERWVAGEATQGPTVITRRAGAPAVEPPTPRVRAVEVKPTPIKVPKKGKKAKDLAEEFGARPADEATDLVTDTSHSGRGAFREEPWKATADAAVPTPKRPPTRRWLDPPPAPEPGPRVLTGEGFTPPEMVVPPRTPKPYTPVPWTEAQDIKRVMQDEADTAFRAQERGNPINSIDMKTDRAMATTLKEALEKNVPTPPGGKSLGELNDATRRSMGVDFLIEDALARRGSLLQNALVGGIGVGAPAILYGMDKPGAAAKTAVAGGVGAGLMSPWATGLGAKGLYKGAPFAGLTQKAMVEAFRKYLEDEEEKDKK